MGRLTKDAVIRYTNDQKAVASLTLAVQDTMNKDKADFISCKAFGKTAELIEKYCHKGDFIGVEGRISTGSYEKDGKKVYTTDVIIDRITFTPKVNTQASEDKPVEEVQEAIPSGFEKIEDDDLPFDL